MKVHIRKRQITSKGSTKPRYTLYLDIYYSKRKRKREFLGLYLEPNDTKVTNLESRAPTRQESRAGFNSGYDYVGTSRNPNSHPTGHSLVGVRLPLNSKGFWICPVNRINLLLFTLSNPVEKQFRLTKRNQWLTNLTIHSSSGRS